MRFIFCFLLFGLILSPIFSQSNYLNLDCSSAKQKRLNTVQVGEKTLEYALVKYIPISGKDHFEVDLLLPNYMGATSKTAIMKVLKQLPLKAGQHQIKVFKTCISWNYFYQATTPDPSMEMQLQQGYIGYYEIEK